MNNDEYIMKQKGKKNPPPCEMSIIPQLPRASEKVN